MQQQIETLIQELKAIRSDELTKLVLDDQDMLKILKVSKRTLATYRANGQISFSKVNGRIYYTFEDVQEFLDNHKVKAYRHAGA